MSSLHSELLAKKQYALAALVVDGLITDGKHLMIAQQDFPKYFATKQKIVATETKKHQTKIMRWYYKCWLITKHKPDEADDDTLLFDSWEHHTNC